MAIKVDDRSVAELVKRSGILETLRREDEENRAAAFEAARLRKKAAVDKFLSVKSKAFAARDNAEEKCKATRAIWEASVTELAKASGTIDRIHDEFTRERDQADAELRKHADPRVDATRLLLQQARRNEDGRIKCETQEDLSRAIRRVDALLGELEQIRTGGELGDISDIGAAIDELMKRVP